MDTHSFTSMLRRAHLPVMAALQGVLILWMVHHGFRTWGGHYIGIAGDSSIYLWFLSWWGWALSHGHSLAYTRLVTYPWGNNVLWDTGVPLVFAPLSLAMHARLMSLSLAYNLADFGGWWFSSIAAYWSYYRITRRRVASALGSFLLLSSAYFTNQSLGHVDLMWVGFAFILFAAVFDYVQRERPAHWLLWRFVALSLCLWLTNEEYFVTTQMMIAFGLLFWIRWAFRRGQWNGKRILGILRGYGASLVATGLALAPEVWWQLRTPAQPFRPFTYFNLYQVNLANLFVPIHTWWHYGRGVLLTGNTMEQDGFLGVIFLSGLVVFGIVTRRTRRLEQSALTAWIVWFFILAMGDFLLWTAKANTHIPLPGVLFVFIPILRSIVLGRFMWGVFWGLGLLASLYFRQLASRRLKALFVFWIGAVLASWWPGPYPVSRTEPNTWISAAVRGREISPGEVLLEFPFDIAFNPKNNVLETQIANHFTYRLAEGYLTTNDANMAHFDALITYWVAIQDYGPHAAATRYYQSQLKSPGAAFRHFLRTTHPGLVVLTSMPHEAAMKAWLDSQLGPPSGEQSKTFWWSLKR